MSNYYTYKPGLGAVGEYQSAGRPFASGSIDVNTISSAGTVPCKVEFPYVTSWISLRNTDKGDNDDVFVAFSRNGLPSQGGTNHFKITDEGEGSYSGGDPLHVKVTEIWFEGLSSEFDIVAGLTSIDTSAIVDNWSGSSGVG